MMNRVEMNDGMMEQVIGGKATRYVYKNFHKGCGGVVTCSGPLSFWVCDKCGAESFFKSGIDMVLKPVGTI